MLWVWLTCVLVFEILSVKGLARRADQFIWILACLHSLESKTKHLLVIFKLQMILVYPINQKKSTNWFNDCYQKRVRSYLPKMYLMQYLLKQMGLGQPVFSWGMNSFKRDLNRSFFLFSSSAVVVFCSATPALVLFYADSFVICWSFYDFSMFASLYLFQLFFG